MIIVDGCESNQKISNFANLEEILTNIIEDESLNNRVVTDVLVNGENFSEIYPHQAEDMPSEDIKKVEIRSTPAMNMALEVSIEMDKVARLMESGAINVGRLFREGKDSDALELLQDLLDVTRDFMGLLAHLRDRYLGGADENFANRLEEFSGLISEMSDVLANEDWVLLADLLEYEYVPFCEEWRSMGQTMQSQLKTCVES